MTTLATAHTVRATASHRPDGHARDLVTEGKTYCNRGFTREGVLRVMPLYGRAFDAPADLFEPVPERPVWQVPAPPAQTGLLGTLTVDAHSVTRSSEVAAWYAKYDVPAQTIDVFRSEKPYSPTDVHGTLQATKVLDHCPTLYGGVRVGTGGITECHEPATLGYTGSLGALRAAHAAGHATLTDLGQAWLTWLPDYEASREAHRAATRAWEAAHPMNW